MDRQPVAGAEEHRILFVERLKNCKSLQFSRVDAVDERIVEDAPDSIELM